MNRSISEQSSEPDLKCNRSCNQKLQEDFISSEAAPKIKFKTTKSQRQLKQTQEDTAAEVLNQEWKRVQQRKQKQQQLIRKNDVSTEKKMIAHQKGKNPLYFGVQIVNSQSISVDDDFTQTFQPRCRSPKNKKNMTYQGKIISQRRKFHSSEEKLNLMVLGKSGIGKTSFIDCFFNKNYENLPPIRQKTQQINFTNYRSETECIQINFIDIPGYQDSKVFDYIKNIEEYILAGLKNHISKCREKKFSKKIGRDERVHCCLLFFSGPWLSQHDWQIMKRIENYVNIIPIIAKGDTYTTRQIKEFKRKVFQKKKIEPISWFSVEEIVRQYYPQKLTQLLDGSFGKSPPFVITCCTERQYNQRTKKHEFVRQFRWGRCQLNNQSHNDFKFLKSLLTIYLSELLIKSTDLLTRSFQITSENQVSRDSQQIDCYLPQNNNSLHEISQQSSQQIVEQNLLFSILKVCLPISLTVVGFFGVYYLIKKSK